MFRFESKASNDADELVQPDGKGLGWTWLLLLQPPDGRADSCGGSPRHPGWFFNLRSNQEVTIQVRKEVLSANAEIASPEKRRELWQRLLQIEPGFARYEKRAMGREIPMVLVRPANGV
jgi:hypothetical protein